jgi:hypothetical protein
VARLSQRLASDEDRYRILSEASSAAGSGIG